MVKTTPHSFVTRACRTERPVPKLYLLWIRVPLHPLVCLCVSVLCRNKGNTVCMVNFSPQWFSLLQISAQSMLKPFPPGSVRLYCLSPRLQLVLSQASERSSYTARDYLLSDRWGWWRGCMFGFSDGPHWWLTAASPRFDSILFTSFLF